MLGKKNPPRVFGYNSFLRHRRGTRIGGNDSYQPPGSRNPQGSWKTSKNQCFRTGCVIEHFRFNNYGFRLSPEVLEGLGSSGRLVGIISTYPDTYKCPGSRVMYNSLQTLSCVTGFYMFIYTVDGINKPKVFGNNLLPRTLTGTRIGGNGSYQPPGAP